MSQKTRAKRGRRRARPRRPASPPRPESPYLLTELAARLGVDRKTAHDGSRRGEIPSVRIRRRFLFPRAAVGAWPSGRAPSRAILGRPSSRHPRKVTKQ